MFGFGGLSAGVFILFLAMLIFGPEKLPEIGRMLAKGMAEVRKASNELKRTLNAELAISEQEKEARRLQETAPFPPPPPTAPAWSGGQTVPNLDAPGSSAAVPASAAAAPAPPADIGEAADAELSSEAAYLAAWPEDGSSPAATGSPAPPPTANSPSPAPAAAADSAAPSLPAAPADAIVPADHAAAIAPAAATAPGVPADAAAPAAPAALAHAAAPGAPAVLAPALVESHGAGSGRDSA